MDESFAFIVGMLNLLGLGCKASFSGGFLRWPRSERLGLGAVLRGNRVIFVVFALIFVVYGLIFCVYEGILAVCEGILAVYEGVLAVYEGSLGEY